MLYNYNQTADRVVVTKNCMVKGREVTKTASLPTQNQIIHMIEWARDAIGPITVHIDEATVRQLTDDDKHGDEEMPQYK